MEKEEQRWEREKKEEEKMPSQKGRKRKTLRQARKRPIDGSAGGRLMSCHDFSQECSQVKAAFVPRPCVNELIYLGPHPCTRDIPRDGPAATQMR